MPVGATLMRRSVYDAVLLASGRQLSVETWSGVSVARAIKPKAGATPTAAASRWRWKNLAAVPRRYSAAAITPHRSAP